MLFLRDAYSSKEWKKKVAAMHTWKSVGIGVLTLLLLIVCVRVEYGIYQAQSTNAQPSSEVSVTKVMQENKREKQKEAQKVAYLTFDDGPSQNTERVLNVLKSYEIHATFFLIGSNITEENEQLVRRMVDEGNVVGVHTYSHVAKEIYASVDGFTTDFKQAEQSIMAVTGEKPTLCRFPWGSANNYLKNIEKTVIPWLEKQGYYYCDWNVSAEDSVGNPTEYSILHNIKKDYERYDMPVLLMHDSGCNELTAKMLPEIITMLKDSGYRFDTLDHMETPYQYPKN